MAKRINDKYKLIHMINSLVTFLTLVSCVNLQCIPIDDEFNYSSERGQANSKSKYIIVDGDILVSKEAFQLSIRSPVADGASRLWPNKNIPYGFHESINGLKRRLILKAMDEWSRETCLQFVPVPKVYSSARTKSSSGNNGNSELSYWLNFRADSTGCYSFVGRDENCFRQGQPVSISHGCDSELIVTHEIGHAIGLHHQHNRMDRDSYVHINWYNLMKGSAIYFTKELFDTFDIEYDYTSLMQYNMWHFSKDVMNKSAMVTLNPRYQRLLGKANGISFNDRKAVNYLYTCNETCNNLNETTCFNGGYLRPVSVSTYSLTDQANIRTVTCRCDCPVHTSGQFCQFISDKGYYESLYPEEECGGTINRSSIVAFNRSDASCVWYIEAPSEQTVQLVFNKFQLSPKVDIAGFSTNMYTRVSEETFVAKRLKCALDSLEVRLNNSFDGDFYCDQDIRAGTVMTSNMSSVTILLHSFDSVYSPLRVNSIVNFTVQFRRVAIKIQLPTTSQVPNVSTSINFSTQSPNVITNTSITDITSITGNRSVTSTMATTTATSLNVVPNAMSSLWSFLSLNLLLSLISSLRDRLLDITSIQLG